MERQATFIIDGQEEGPFPLTTEFVGSPDDYGTLYRKFQEACGAEPTFTPGLTKDGILVDYQYAPYLKPEVKFVNENWDKLQGFIASHEGRKIPSHILLWLKKIFSIKFLQDAIQGKVKDVFIETKERVENMKEGAKMYQNIENNQ